MMTGATWLTFNRNVYRKSYSFSDISFIIIKLKPIRQGEQFCRQPRLSDEGLIISTKFSRTELDKTAKLKKRKKEIHYEIFYEECYIRVKNKTAHITHKTTSAFELTCIELIVGW
jgi:hypothetical protein